MQTRVRRTGTSRLSGQACVRGRREGTLGRGQSREQGVSSSCSEKLGFPSGRGDAGIQPEPSATPQDAGAWAAAGGHESGGQAEPVDPPRCPTDHRSAERGAEARTTPIPPQNGLGDSVRWKARPTHLPEEGVLSPSSHRRGPCSWKGALRQCILAQQGSWFQGRGDAGSAGGVQ